MTRIGHHPPTDEWSTFRDPNAAASDRLDALDSLQGGPLESQASDFLVDELVRTDLPDEWRDALVFAAEDRHFPVELRERLCGVLLRLATSLRDQPNASEQVIWSALRRGLSLLPAENVDRVLPFLAPGGSVDLRAVALQGIARIFEPHPPTDVPTAVADRVYRFAERFGDVASSQGDCRATLETAMPVWEMGPRGPGLRARSVGGRGEHRYRPRPVSSVFCNIASVNAHSTF